VIPCEFLVAANGHERDLRHQHELLLANCLAQSEALMLGRDLEAARATVADPDLAPHKVFAGDRPSTTLIYDRLDPATLGRIVALYEHRVFVEGTIWGLNSFDQWGVELGKELATALLPMVTSGAGFETKDGSTAGLLKALADLRALARHPGRPAPSRRRAAPPGSPSSRAGSRAAPAGASRR
jgi:glucose-6-phosphate isomerase